MVYRYTSDGGLCLRNRKDVGCEGLFTSVSPRLCIGGIIENVEGTKSAHSVLASALYNYVGRAYGAERCGLILLDSGAVVPNIDALHLDMIGECFLKVLCRFIDKALSIVAHKVVGKVAEYELYLNVGFVKSLFSVKGGCLGCREELLGLLKVAYSEICIVACHLLIIEELCVALLAVYNVLIGVSLCYLLVLDS